MRKRYLSKSTPANDAEKVKVINPYLVSLQTPIFYFLFLKILQYIHLVFNRNISLRKVLFQDAQTVFKTELISEGSI